MLYYHGKGKEEHQEREGFTVECRRCKRHVPIDAEECVYCEEEIQVNAGDTITITDD